MTVKIKLAFTVEKRFILTSYDVCHRGITV